MSDWSDEYGPMVCARCRMPRDQSDHTDIYDCIRALGAEVSRLAENEHRRALTHLDNPPKVTAGRAELWDLSQGNRTGWVPGENVANNRQRRTAAIQLIQKTKT